MYNSVTSGHASITIEKNNERIKSYGYYPQGLAEDYSHDGFVAPKDASWFESFYANEAPQGHPKMNQSKFCHDINEADVERTNALARGYANKFGRWNLHRNNCVSFAKYIYSSVTKDSLTDFPSQPRALYNNLTRASQRHVSNLSELNAPSPQTQQTSVTEETAGPMTPDAVATQL